MKKASPVDIRTALESANAMARAGLDFVCIPVLDDGDKDKLVEKSVHRLETLAQQAEADEKQ